ncbi:NAD-dependent epimerase/dehydratase family protein [Actinocrispum wychmicini]|uniref:Nucleoside-diphosphate-sugar epimerase n=1 Tax=Actinocrispum wychmicini TaxID=1213861 RepID=A0A4V2S7L8_9PSEU|nr:NAD(P)-dependent oxidoreductase [Actinocrispum wychmicini]TCO60530.1 nucleoside-diphosphate-sugar epimerase [Actinocrispum wychmicini]
MRLAVTGASGFVGGAVCRAATEAGWTVHAFGRRAEVAGEHVGGAPYQSWDIARGPLPRPPTVDAVVHCAGSVTDWAPRREQWAANVDGTRHMLETFADVRVVHVSTASVYDPYRPTVAAVENQAPVQRYVNTYGESKAAAERLVSHHPDAVILRPHAIYGPGDTTLLPRVLQAIRGRRLIAVGDGTQRISLTSVANLTQACLLAAGADATGIFNVTDAEPVLLADALTTILAERAIPARVKFVPLPVAWPVAWLAEKFARRNAPPRLTRYAVSHLAYERTLDITAARTVLGYEPLPTSFAGASRW